MPDKRNPKRCYKEFPILYSRWPFCLTSAADFNLDHLKTSLIDESLALDLNLPIRNLQYQRFSLSEDKTVWSRLNGTLKLTAQVLEKGRAGKSFQLKAKVIRNLTKITGAEAVCDVLLEEKLFSLPVVYEKPEKKVEKWLKKQGKMVPTKAPPSLNLKSEQDPSTWPPSTATPFYSKCRCDWSEASTRGTACCKHRGSCQHCLDNLADVATDVDNCSEGPPKNFREDVDIKLSEEPPDDIKEEVDTTKKKEVDTNDATIDDSDDCGNSVRYIPYNGNVNLVMVNSPTTLGLDNDSDTDDDEVMYEVNSFVDGRIVREGIYKRMSEMPPVSEDEDDLVVQRMTGDRLREYHARHRSTSISRAESHLRELDKMRRYLKMKFPGEPPLCHNYGDLDIYLNKKAEELRIRKEGLNYHLKEEDGDANRCRVLVSDRARLHWPHQPIRRLDMMSRDQSGPMRSLDGLQRI